MTEQVLIIEEGVALPPPGKTGPRQGGGMLGTLSSMQVGQSAFIARPDETPFYVWRSRISGLLGKANQRMKGAWLVSRREGNGVRVFCIVKAEG